MGGSETGESDRGQQGAGSLARLREEGAKDVNMDSNSRRIAEPRDGA